MSFLRQQRRRSAVRTRTTPTSPFRASFRSLQRTLNIQGEFFNAFNHPPYADPATAYGTANFGYIQSTSVAPRIIQLAAKFQF
jgi:hypothetical protein